MRIVAMADTHNQHERIHVPDGDVLVHAGDLCGWGDLDELDAAGAWLSALPHAIKIVVAGNHDWAFARHPIDARRCFADDVVYLQDSGADPGGLRVWGSPWQPRFNDWAFNLPRGAALAEKWALIPDGTELLITHGPPYGVGDAVTARRHEGCSNLRERVAMIRPRLHLFGHIHEDRGAWRHGSTVFANVTVDEGRLPPMVIDLDGDRVIADGVEIR